MPASEELKKAQDKIRTLKAELAQITAAATKPSRGLQDALTATQAAQVVPEQPACLLRCRIAREWSSRAGV